MPACQGATPIHAHLIKRQVLLRELPAEVSAAAIDDPRTWVLACGGITGCSGHHGHFDKSRRLRVPRSAIPKELEALCREWEREGLWLGATVWLDREYSRAAVPLAHRAVFMEPY